MTPAKPFNPAKANAFDLRAALRVTATAKNSLKQQMAELWKRYDEQETLEHGYQTALDILEAKL